MKLTIAIVYMIFHIMFTNFDNKLISSIEKSSIKLLNTVFSNETTNSIVNFVTVNSDTLFFIAFTTFVIYALITVKESFLDNLHSNNLEKAKEAFRFGRNYKIKKSFARNTIETGDYEEVISEYNRFITLHNNNKSLYRGERLDALRDFVENKLFKVIANGQAKVYSYTSINGIKFTVLTKEEKENDLIDNIKPRRIRRILSNA